MTETIEQGSDPKTKKMPSIRKHAIIAASLFVIDAFVFNQGVISILVYYVSFVCLFVFTVMFLLKKSREVMKIRILIAVIYIVAAFMVQQANSMNQELAMKRAKMVIAACEDYKNKHGAYPAQLTDLVPEFLQEVPATKIVIPTGISNTAFRYSTRDGRHDLMYVHFPPFGRPIYHFETKKWGYLD